jgi:hypothetical protein
MQPRKPVVDPVAVDVEAGALDAAAALDVADPLAAGVLLLALEVLLPHAATSRVAAPAAATVTANEVCLTFPLHWTRLPTPTPGKGAT